MTHRDSGLDVANVAAHLPKMAREQPEVSAIIAPRSALFDSTAADQTSYRALDEESDYYASGLREIGLAQGARVVLMVPPSLPFFALTFGMFKAGVIPVVLDPAMGRERLSACIERSEPDGFIGIPKAHLARRALGWGKRSIRANVVVGRGASMLGLGDSRTVSLDALRALGVKRGREKLAPVSEDDTAAILFTSGSTGVPKGAVYSHGNFLAQVESIRSMYEIQPGEIDLPTFPLFALFDPALGMTTIIPRMDFTKPGSVDGAAIVGPIQRYRVTNMFGSPALLDRVAEYANGKGAKLPSLRRVITAGAPVTPRILERFSALLSPEARIHTPYGATESLPIATIDHRTVLDTTRAATDKGAGICVGHPVRTAKVFIMRIEDGARATLGEEMPVGEVGEICVSGPQVTRAYFRDEQNTDLHKMRDGDGSIWHRVGDVGYRDAEGRIWFCGRKAHRVVIGDNTYFAEQLEGPFNALPWVKRSALVGPKLEGRIVLTMLLDAPVPVGNFALSLPPELAEGIAAPIERIVFRSDFPVDPRHNAKIDRDALRQELEAQGDVNIGHTWSSIATLRNRRGIK